MQVILSDDRTTVVVLDGDKEEQLTLEEFAEMYGEAQIPQV